MTLHKLSAGDGYLYYTREVASADELRSPDRKLGDYYTVTGHPPGIWEDGVLRTSACMVKSPKSKWSCSTG